MSLIGRRAGRCLGVFFLGVGLAACGSGETDTTEPPGGPSPAYQLAVEPDSLLVDKGSSAQATLTMLRGDSATQSAGVDVPVDLSFEGMPKGASVLLTVDPAAPRQKTLEVSAGPDASPGATKVIVRSESQGDIGPATLELTIVEPEGLAVALTEPPADSLVSGDIELKAAVMGQSSAKALQFQVAGQPHGNLQTDAPYTARFDTTNLPDGLTEFSAVAWNPAGDPAASRPHRVVVANETGAVSGRLKGELEEPKKVFLYDTDTWETLHTVETSADQGYAYRFVAVPPGIYGLDAGDCDPSRCIPTRYGYADEDPAVAETRELADRDLEMFDIEELQDEIKLQRVGRTSLRDR